MSNEETSFDDFLPFKSRIKTDKNENNFETNKDVNFELECKWDGCDYKISKNDSKLLNHIITDHLFLKNNMDDLTIDKICYWNDCVSYGKSFLNKTEMLEHCYSHTNENPYICPVPECNLFFNKIINLKNHFKVDHGLITFNEYLANLNDNIKIKKNFKLFYDESNPLDENDSIESNLLNCVEKNYKYFEPWWYSDVFSQTFSQHNLDSNDNSEENNAVENYAERNNYLFNFQYDFRQHEIAISRYKSFLNDQNNDILEFNDQNADFINVITRIKQSEMDLSNKKDDYDEICISNKVTESLLDDSNKLKLQYLKKKNHFPKINNTKTLEDLKDLYKELNNRLHVANKINKIVTKSLSETLEDKRKQWVVNQILLDANIIIGLPPKKSNIPKRVVRDEYDDQLLYD